MKILMINSVCGVKSTGRICTDIAKKLSDEGHEVKIAYGRESAPVQHKKYAVRVGNSLNVRHHVLMSRFFDRAGFYSRCATKKFIKWVKTFDPDVIHLHNIHGYYINIKILFDYLKTCGKKIIWTLHDCWAFTGHCAYFDYVNCDKWQSNCNKCPQKKQYPVSLFKDNSFKNYIQKKQCFLGVPNLTIITPSKWLAGLVDSSFLREYPVKTIHNGVDVEIFKPTKSDFKERNGLSAKRIILGVASVWDRRKGLKDFIKLSTALGDEYKIVLVGVTDGQIKSLPQNVLGIKRTNSVSELAEIYSSADYFFNPTLEDNYPTTNLEAVACGTPVITYDTGGSAESARLYGIAVGKCDIESVKKIILSTQTFEKKDVLTVQDMVTSYIDCYLE